VLIGRQRVVACEDEFQVRQVVVAPEDLVANAQGRHAEDTGGDRRVGLLAQPGVKPIVAMIFLFY
jgi:hypothetical protein